MLESWFNFAVVVCVQLLLLVTYAYFTKRLSDLPRILGWAIPTGLVVGLLSDLIWGEYFGFWSYTLGFGALSLTLTAVFIYGLFATHILLMQRVRLLHFFTWTMVIMTVYETTNHFFRIWTYELILPTYGLSIFLVAGYFATAVFIALVWHIFFKRRFLFIENLLRK
jgi:hypothetical protein